MQKEQKVKLLILTQKVDQNDDVLGFFHGWIAEFAKHCEQVTVIALGVGEHHLPANVRVFSLGKERGASRLGYILNFYRLIWHERKNYDTVFVHMNQEYILLGGLLWKFLGKKITMWRNHPVGSLLTRLAMVLSDKLFCTSKYSFTAQSKKTVLMPAGVDTELFKRDGRIFRVPRSILFLGRISPIKNVDVLVDALLEVDQEGCSFTATVVGKALPRDEAYETMIKDKAKSLIDKGKIKFVGSIANNRTPEVYDAHELFVNLTDTGSFDKTILEAMACECVTLVSNRSFAGMIPNQFIFAEKDSHDLALKIAKALSLSDEEKAKTTKASRKFVYEHHSLAFLAEQLIKEVK